MHGGFPRAANPNVSRLQSRHSFDAFEDSVSGAEIRLHRHQMQGPEEIPEVGGPRFPRHPVPEVGGTRFAAPDSRRFRSGWHLVRGTWFAPGPEVGSTRLGRGSSRSG